MKRAFLILSILLLVSSQAFAGGNESCDDYDNETSDTWYHTHCYNDKDTDTDTDTNTTHGSEAGVGSDVVLWQSEKEDPTIEEVLAEYRYDIKNSNHQVYGVVRVNLWQKIKGFFGR